MVGCVSWAHVDHSIGLVGAERSQTFADHVSFRVGKIDRKLFKLMLGEIRPPSAWLKEYPVYISGVKEWSPPLFNLSYILLLFNTRDRINQLPQKNPPKSQYSSFSIVLELWWRYDDSDDESISFIIHLSWLQDKITASAWTKSVQSTTLLDCIDPISITTKKRDPEST